MSNMEKLEKQNAELNARLRKELETWRKTRDIEFVNPFPKKTYVTNFPKHYAT